MSAVEGFEHAVNRGGWAIAWHDKLASYILLTKARVHRNAASFMA